MDIEKPKLADDPMDNIGGTRYLRLSNDCPPNGVVLELSKPKVVFNDKFGGKDEYQWPCIHYTPEGFDKILTESSKGFCTALKNATGGAPYGKLLQIKWRKTKYNGNGMKDDKMLRMRKHHKSRMDRKQIARTTKRNLTLLITFLAEISLVLIFRVGESFWPMWMIEYRTRILGIILLAEVCTILLSPLIIEVNSNPRPLSGPGKNPQQGG